MGRLPGAALTVALLLTGQARAQCPAAEIFEPYPAREELPSLSADGARVAYTLQDAAFVLAPRLFVYEHAIANLYSLADCVPFVGPDISGDGAHVVFRAPSDDVVVREIATGIDTTVHDGTNPDGLSLSHDGGQAVFFDTLGVLQVLRVDVSSGVGEVVGLGAEGQLGNADSWCAKDAQSADGACIAFVSDASNLVPGDTNGESDVFVRDVAAGTTTRVSVASGGTQSSGSCNTASISADGQIVAFNSAAANLVPGDVNGVLDVFVHDRQTGVTTLASVSSTGQQADLPCFDVSLSGDGRFVVYKSQASTLVDGDTNGNFDVFQFDRVTRMTIRVSTAPDGSELTTLSKAPTINHDGGVIAYVTSDVGVLGNGAPPHVILRGPCDPASPQPYCTAQVNSQGCTPAIGSSGAPSASSGLPFDVTATGVLNNKSGLLFYGVGGPTSAAFAGGLKCVVPPTRRTPLQASGGNPPPDDCSGLFTIDFNARIESGVDPALIAGQPVWAQYWSRDPASAASTNLTDALAFAIGP